MSPLTGVLSEAWDLYRRFASHFLLIAFVIYVITAILVALLSLAGVVGAILGAILGFAATYVVQASLIKAVQDVRDGRVDLDLSETVQAASPYILPVIGAAILAGIGITIGFILLIVPGLILLTFWCLIIPFLALVATLIYYRLIAAHGGETYVPTGPAGAQFSEPPYPTMPPSTPRADPAPPGPPAPDSTAPGPTAPDSTKPFPAPGPTGPGPTEPGPATPPDRGPGTPPPPSTP
jgi:hypothetical protein